MSSRGPAQSSVAVRPFHTESGWAFDPTNLFMYARHFCRLPGRGTYPGMYQLSLSARAGIWRADAKSFDQGCSGEHGARQIFLEVRESNSVAIKMYLNHGFNEVGRRLHYYPTAIGREDALVYGLY